MPITGKIDVKKIDKALLFEGKKGTYLDVVFFENRDGEDEYGNSGFIAQGVSKEARESGVKGPIIGNWRGGKQKQAPAKQAQRPAAKPPADPDLEPESDDIPF